MFLTTFVFGAAITSCLEASCFPNYFDCGEAYDGNSTCILDKQVCDSNPDCPKQLDEQNCPGTQACGEGTKLCKGSCIPASKECVQVKPTCTYPGFLCNNQSCLQGNKVCDGNKDCGDGSDELGCHKIQLTIAPNDTYYTQPDSVIYVGVDAITDVDWMNALVFRWYWFRPKVAEGGPNKGQEVIVKEILPPRDMYMDFFFVSLSGKDLSITIPEINREALNKTLCDIYNVLTNCRMYQVVVKHKYDSVEWNFTIIGDTVCLSRE